MKPLNLSYTEQLHTELNAILLTVIINGLTKYSAWQIPYL